MLDELLEVGTKLFEASDRLQQAGEKRRKCIADYFLNIEECLRDSVEQLKSGQVPNSKWGELKVYARKLPSTVGQEIGRETAEELSLLLLSTAKNIPTDQDIPSIEAAAGKFKGLANTITTRQSSNKPARRKILTYAAIGTAGFIGGLAPNYIRSGTLPGGNPPKSGSSEVDSKFPLISWEMPTFLGESVAKTILYRAPSEVCKRIEEMTGGRFLIKVKPTGDTAAILDMVSKGVAPCGYAGIYYAAARYSLFFGCAIPFGLTPQEQNAWLDYKKESTGNLTTDDLTFVQSIYKKLGLDVISFPAGGTGAQAGGWFNKKIESVDDFRNLKMRTIGIGGEILKRYFGVITLDDLARGENRPNIPMNEAIERLRRGDIDAIEWTGPYDDMELGLHETGKAKFYHYPGWWEPSATFDVQVNVNKWRELPETYRTIFKAACRETHLSILAEYERKNSEAFVKLKKLAPQQGIQLVRFSDDILAFAREKTEEFLKVYGCPGVSVLHFVKCQSKLIASSGTIQSCETHSLCA